MDDLISRQAAIDAIGELCSCTLDEEARWREIIGRIPPAQQEQRWIPVSERLPETDGYYLVTIQTFWWHGEQSEDVDIARYEQKNGWHKSDECIAWMPQPAPYRPEGEEHERA